MEVGAHDRDAGPEEGLGQGCAARSETLASGDDGRIYLQEIPKGVQATVNSINAELRKRPEPGPQRETSDAKVHDYCFQTRKRSGALTPIANLEKAVAVS